MMHNELDSKFQWIRSHVARPAPRLKWFDREFLIASLRHRENKLQHCLVYLLTLSSASSH